MKPNRPQTLNEVAEWSNSLEEFGMNLRDWQHEIQRGGVHSRVGLERRLSDKPKKLSCRFPEGDVADAYLAAYAEWLADSARITRLSWCANQKRVTNDPWFSSPARALLLVRSPASFRQRGLFTIPHPIFIPKAGRPRVSPELKREKARLRQKAYRKRIRSLIETARRIPS